MANRLQKDILSCSPSDSFAGSGVAGTSAVFNATVLRTKDRRLAILRETPAIQTTARSETCSKTTDVAEAAYTKAVASVLKALICSGGDDAVYVLRGALRGQYDDTDGHFLLDGRLVGTGSAAPALVDFIMGVRLAQSQPR